MPSRGGRSGGRRGLLPRNVQVSKKVAWLLRHGAEEEGLKLDEGGFLNVQDVLSNRKVKSLQVTLDELREIVEGNDKQRFTMVPITSSPGQVIGDAETNGQQAVPSSRPQYYLIRANQGHSLKVEDEGLLKPITADSAPTTPVHGTTHAAWPLIVASGGLKPMTRNHVHFASGLPSGFTSIVDTDAAGVDAPVISGMRRSSTVLMFLDLTKALEAGLKLWVSDNGVVLSEGNAEGLVPLELFKRVESRTGEGVLLEDGKVVKEAPSSWKGKCRGKD